MVPYLKQCLALTLCVTALGTPAIAHACSPDYARELDDDEILTRLQKENLIEKNCVGKPIEATGLVLNVDKGEIKIKDASGFRYDFYLMTDHGCGDLLAINKMQRLTLAGNIRRVYVDVIAGQDMTVHDGRCI